jgi:hypothetical protein
MLPPRREAERASHFLQEHAQQGFQENLEIYYLGKFEYWRLRG